jgi:integrase
MARRRYQRGSLEERRSGWYGRYLDDVIQADGTIKRVHKRTFLGPRKEFATRKLAMRELERIVGDAGINLTSYRPKRTATFSEFAERWKATVLTQMKPSTQAAARSHLKCILLPAFASLQLGDLTPFAIQSQVATWNLSAKSKHNVIATLRSMWRTAHEWNFVSTSFPNLKMPEVVSRKVRVFTEAEIRSILNAAEEPYKTLYMLAAETGLRAGELCGLTWENIDIEKGIVFVRQSVWRRRVQSPKSKTALRAVTISDHLAEHLRQQRRTGFLFASKDGRPTSQFFVVQRKLRPLLERLGIEAGGLHAFRHAHGSMMGNIGIPVKVIQERMGHADVRMSMHYTHIVNADSRAISEQYEQVLYPSCGTRAN